MKRKTGIAAICVLACSCGVLVFFSFPHTGVKADPSSAIPQPKIKNFPDPQLPILRQNGKPAPIRKHAWDLLEQLTQNIGTGQDKHPLWEFWNTKCDSGPLSQFCDHQNLPAAAIQRPTDRSPAQFSTVYYVPDIHDWILKNHLYDSNYLYRQLTDGASRNQPEGSPTMINPVAPDTSIVVKEIWEAVNPDPNDNGSLTIPIYDPKDFDPKATTLKDPYIDWVKNKHGKLQLLLNDDAERTLDKNTPCQPGVPISEADLSSPVPADCFVYRYTSAQCDTILAFKVKMRRPKVDLDPVSPCVAVLVGVQIMTREFLPNWTWSTFWWTPNPASLNNNPDTGKPYDRSEGRPPDLGPGFQNFAMDTLLSKDEVPKKKLKPLFNPYLEGPMPHGAQSNCLTCHYKASYVPQQSHSVLVGRANPPEPVGPHDGLPGVDQDGQNSLLGPDKPNIAQDCSWDLLADPRRNHCRLRTGFLWSIPTNQDCKTTDPFHDIVQLNHNIFSVSRPKPAGLAASQPETSGSKSDPCNSIN